MLKPKHQTVIKGHTITQYEAKGSQEQIIRQIQKFKRRLDIVLNATAWGNKEVTAADIQWANEIGFSLAELAPSGTGMSPVSFIKLLVGPFLKYMAAKSELVTVPSWTLIGWNRRRYKAHTQAEADATQNKLLLDTLSKNDGHAYIVEPFEFVICSEGKHRYELFADYFLEMPVNVTFIIYPKKSRITLRKVWRTNKLLHICHRDEDGGVSEALLPFADLSETLLAHAGIKVCGTWIACPWSSTVQELAHYNFRRAIALSINPSELQKIVLASSYV